MSEQKHTPGPWRIDPGHSRDIQSASGLEIASAFAASVVGDTWRICGPSVSDDEAEANAHLISAAPDLLEALKIARSGLDFFMTHHPVLAKEAANIASLAEIDAAIAKAEGSSQ